ncbi:MAG TPA: hypothetical protein VF117_00560 [Gammaproteobacteria bacterium]
MLVVILVQVLLIWPVYALVPAVHPFVFGFPFGFAWLVFCILIAFLALLMTFFADMRAAEQSRRDDGHSD